MSISNRTHPRPDSSVTPPVKPPTKPPAVLSESCDGQIRCLIIECPYGRTRIAQLLTGPVQIRRTRLVEITAARHEEECGQCDLTRVLRQGDPQFRAMVEARWESMQPRGVL